MTHAKHDSSLLASSRVVAVAEICQVRYWKTFLGQKKTSRFTRGIALQRATHIECNYKSYHECSGAAIIVVDEKIIVVDERTPR